MYIWVVSFVVAIISGATAYCGIVFTDKQLDYNKKYRSNSLWPILIVTISVAGGFSAYITINKAVSLFAFTKLMATCVLIAAAAIYDYKLRIIPNMILLLIIFIWIVLLIIEMTVGVNVLPFLLSSLIGSLSMTILLYIASKLTKGGIGYGDIKLIGAIGLCTGFYSVFAVLLCSLATCMVFAILLVLLKKKKMSGDVPFAPFIYIGYLITLMLSLY